LKAHFQRLVLANHKKQLCTVESFDGRKSCFQNGGAEIGLAPFNY